MLVAAAALAAALVVHADAGEHANAVYNILCLAQQVPCTQAKYDRLWKDELRWSAEDQAQLDRWRSILRAAEERSPAPPASPLLANYLSFYPALRLRQSVAAAALESSSASTLERRLLPLVGAGDARTLAGVVRHFKARLHPWWERVGRQRVRAVRAIDREFSPAIRALLRQVAAFVQADPSVADVHMHVVPSPDIGTDEAAGTVVRNHFFMELVPTGSDAAAAAEATKMVVGVAVHELTHALYDSAPVATHLALMQQFVGAAEPGGPPMYAFLNEAIATAVTNMAFGLENDDASGNAGEYRHAYIPRLGRAAAEPLKRSLAAGATMTDGFAAGYLRAAREELGADADSLPFRFAATAIIASEATRPAVAVFREVVSPTYSTESRATWQRVGELNAAFLVSYGDIGEFADRIPDVKGLTQHRGFAFLLPHNTRGRILVLAGREAAAVTDVIRQLQKSKAIPDNGLVVTVD